MLNPKMIERQGIGEDEIQTIIDLHNERLHLFHRLKKVDPETAEGRAELREGVKTLEKIEYGMQEAWGFPQSRAHHTWWYEIPHCCCPRSDNRDMFGVDQRFIRRNCPAHSE
jgi:hypothetical protein